MESLELVEVLTRELMLFAAAGLLIGGIDDLLVDLLFVARRAWRGSDLSMELAGLPAVPSSRAAIFVPAWAEAQVIGPMLRTLLARLGGDFTVYVAVYPNDGATIAAVRRVGDPRVRLVLNGTPGPSTKADNLNAAWRAMREDDARSGLPTRFVVLHDAEDVVHADELRVFDALIGRFDVVQLPVRPLVRDGFCLIAGTYSDSFAEANWPLSAYAVPCPVGAGASLDGIIAPFINGRTLTVH